MLLIKFHLEISFPGFASLYYEHGVMHTINGSSNTVSKANSFNIEATTGKNSFSNISFGFQIILNKAKKNRAMDKRKK